VLQSTTVFVLKCLLEYLVDSWIDGCCFANVAEPNRDGNAATNVANVARLTKSDLFRALDYSSSLTKFARRGRFFFAWHCVAILIQREARSLKTDEVDQCFGPSAWAL
jgi:hypothetical protein